MEIIRSAKTKVVTTSPTFIAIILFILASSFLSSCSILHLNPRKKKTVPTADTTTTITADTARISAHDTLKVAQLTDTLPPADTVAIARNLADEANLLFHSRFDYKTFSGKAKMHFESLDGGKDFTANIRIRKDSVIWINITAFGGLPAARIFITRDSFFMTIPLQREAMILPLTAAAKVLPTEVDFSSLQNLFTGEPLRDGSITSTESLGDSLTVHAEDPSYLQRIIYNKADSTMRNANLNTKIPNGPQAFNSYTDYANADGRKVSMNRVLYIQNKNDVYQLEINFSSIGFDLPLEYPFSIPRGYKLK